MPSQTGFSRNRLLSAMRVDDFERLRPHLERVRLGVRQVLEEPYLPIEYIYFPEPSICSVVALSPDGERLEISLFGPEGMSGLAYVQGTDRSPFRTVVQVAGSGHRLPAQMLRTALDDSAALRSLLQLYVQAHSIQVAYTALANGRYAIDHRLARWILMCLDRVDGNAVNLTHEVVGMMLGVRRAGVTTALQYLETAQIIQMTRGRIDVLDRARLEEAAGGSYGTPEAEYERLLASSI